MLQSADGCRSSFLSYPHIVVLLAEMIQPILAHGKQQRRFELRLVKPPVIDGDLGAGVGVQCVEQFGIVQEHGCLVFLAGDLVVDVGKRERLGKLSSHLENSVRPDAADGDGILHRTGNAELVPFRLGGFAESFNNRHPPLQVLGPKFFLQPVCSRLAFSSCGAASYPVQWQAAMPGSTDCLTERQGSGVSELGT